MPEGCPRTDSIITSYCKENTQNESWKKKYERDWGIQFSGGLNKNGPHRPIGSGTIGRCGLAGGSVSLGVGFEVLEIQVRPSGSLALPVGYQSRCRTLSYLSSTLSALMLPCSL